MANKIQVVSTDEFTQQVGKQRFKALPQEEIDRLYATVEVLTTQPELATNPLYRMLCTYTAIHYNYSWLTYRSDNAHGKRSLGIGGAIEPKENPLFLEEGVLNDVMRTLEENLDMPTRPDVRLAGLIDDGDGRLGVVYVAKLRQREVVAFENGIRDVQLCGSGELPEKRDSFDSWSQILIDHLVAL